MRLRRLAALASCIAVSHAFQGTSPLIVVSTSSSALDKLPLNNAITRSSQIQSQIKTLISECPTDHYVLVTQPEISASEFRSKSVPHLYRKLSAENDATFVHRSFEMLGNLNITELDTLLIQKCKSRVLVADPMYGIIPHSKEDKQVIRVAFPQLPVSFERAGRLIEHDSYLNAILDTLPGNSYTLVYATTPNPYAVEVEQQRLEMGYGYEYDNDLLLSQALHQDLRRDVEAHLKKRQDEPDDPQRDWNSDAPIFEKYNFFNPALFMTIPVVLLMLSIGYAGVSWLASIQVTYAAFSKEMGPAAQKKQQ